MDDHYPGDDGRLHRVYIPTGIQHMTGEEALVYARSRHASTDFDRAQRQQRVLLSLREQANIGQLIPKLPSLVKALRNAVHTDIPINQLPQTAAACRLRSTRPTSAPTSSRRRSTRRST